MVKRGLLFFILCLYGLLYVATSKAPPCGEDCKMVNKLDKELRKGRKYVTSVYSNSRWQKIETIFVLVVEKKGMDWYSFADTVCRMASERDLLQQKVIILKNGPYPYDTLAIKQCN